MLTQQLLEAETVRAIFLDNKALCSEVSTSVVQHFVRATARCRHQQYIKLLQSIIKPKGSLIRKCQDMVMSEVSRFHLVPTFVFSCTLLVYCLDLCLYVYTKFFTISELLTVFLNFLFSAEKHTHAHTHTHTHTHAHTALEGIFR